MNPIATDFKNSGQKIISALKEDLKTIRSGRANPSMIEGLMIDAYGGSTKMRLMEMASIVTEGPALLVVAPFDPSTTVDIEKGILKSPLGVSPRTQAGKILVSIPPLSQEQREKMIRLVNQKIEEARVKVRNARDEARKKIKTQFDQKEITEDQKFRMEKEMDTITQNLNTEIQTIKDNKETELKEV